VSHLLSANSRLIGSAAMRDSSDAYAKLMGQQDS
jgi:hypothetical protein